MSKRVLSIGQCVPDNAMLRRYLEQHFTVDFVTVEDATGALKALRNQPFDLALVNRKLDVDYSDGLEVIRQIKADSHISQVPIMLVTNYAEHQDDAIAAGAVRGFGKLDYGKPETHERLGEYLA